MNEQTTLNEQAATPASPVTEATSLADYRTWRDKPAAERPETATEAPTEQAEPTDDDTEGELAEDSETSETEAGKESEGKPTKKGGYKRKIDKLRSELDELKGKLAGQPATAPAEATPAAPAAPAPNAPQFAEAEPQLEDFENIGDYTKALLKWDRARTSFEQAHEQARQKQAESHKTILAAWKTNETAAKAKHADYDAALAAVAEVKVPAPHQRALLESEHGPEVAYHLAKHPEELKSFVAMNPLAAARAIGKIEASFASQPASIPGQKPKVSSAPAPIRTVAGKAVASFDVSKASLGEYRTAREQGRVR